MAFTIPTTPCTTTLTYAEMDVKFTDVMGESAGLISTTLGQRLAEAADISYWDIVSCLLKWGYTAAQVTSWLAARGHSMHDWLAAYYWLSWSGVSRDHAVFADAIRFRESWEKLCAEGGPIFDSTGALLKPDPTISAAALQAQSSVQNNSAGKYHTFRVDADPRQMLPGQASTIVGGTHYDNPSYP